MMFKGKTRQIPLQVTNTSITGFCFIGPAATMHPCIFDTGAEFTVIPQRFWMEQFRREEIEKPEYQKVNLRKGYGHTCRARRFPLRIWIMGAADPNRLLGAESGDHATENIIDFGVCEADLAFDEDAAYPSAVEQRANLLKSESDPGKAPGAALKTPAITIQPLKVIYIGLGGGTFRNGGLCINWTIPEAVLVEQIKE